MNRALQWKLIVGFLLVFIAGATTGGFFGASHARHLFFGPPHQGVIAERMRERLRSQLHLTPEQLANISPIIDKTAAQLEETRHETGRRVRELFTASHQEMAPHLTAEQRTKLQEMEQRHSRWMEHGRGSRRRSASPSPGQPEE